MNKPFFSILIPNLGLNKYFFKCVDSVANQITNNKFDFEVIICDQSDKATYSKILKYILEKYKESKIDLTHCKIKSLFNSRIVLSKKAKGEYIQFVDSDDYLEPDFLYSIYDKIVSHKPDIFIHELKTIDEDGKLFFKQDLFDINNDNVFDFFNFSFLVNSVCMKTFKRKLFSEQDYSVIDINTTNAEDRVFSMPIMKKAKSICFDKLDKYCYVQHKESMIHVVTFNRSFNGYQITRPQLMPQTSFHKKIVFYTLSSYFFSSSVNILKSGQFNLNDFNKYFNEYRKDLLHSYKISPFNSYSFKSFLTYLLVLFNLKRLTFGIIKRKSK